ncbi:hypothetical protein [[Mycobacterium] nativiensis]|uniref:Uncharacterized protein n=1 Tax=[Mycobacterium] nativiensis TaxID=2855503 RepID=A0ABU5Y3X7_9MYCO|nr:hypothetical protein [Mycolicibacter sp. MYC340]MEB3034906.1 hypothetical protein [Mycolicibacter sp. MYC340]
MSSRRRTLILSATAGASAALGLIALATGPVAHADEDGITITPGVPDPDFMSGPDQNFGFFSDQAFADPDEHFQALIFQIPSLGITDVLTSGIDPSDGLAAFDPGLPTDVSAGTVDVTVNTFTDTMDPALDSTTTIPFTDPLTDLWVALLPLGF